MYLHPVLAEHLIAARRGKLEASAANHRLIHSVRQGSRRSRRPWPFGRFRPGEARTAVAISGCVGRGHEVTSSLQPAR